MVSLWCMRKDKEEALSLRKSGASYKQIKDELGVSKSTLSEWFKDHPWSLEIGINLVKRSQVNATARIQAINKIRGIKLDTLYSEAETEAKKEFQILKYHPLFIASLMLYWGEGDKMNKHRVSIVNSEPEMLRIFIFFLRNICNIDEDKVHAWILAYPDMNLDSTLSFWVEKTGLNRKYFKKTIVIKGRHQSRRLSNGVCTVRVLSTLFKKKMLIWLDCFKKEMVSEDYFAGVV